MAVLPGAFRDGEVGELELELGLDETHSVLSHIQQYVADADRPGTLFCHLKKLARETWLWLAYWFIS